MPEPAPINRTDFSWLAGTYWYCPAIFMPALRISGPQLQPVIDQTVWFISGAKDGYFWGTAAALVTPAGHHPHPAMKVDMTFIASATPSKRVHITFVQSSGETTIGTGVLTSACPPSEFEMQMSSTSESGTLTHWARMRQISPKDPEWKDLPGAGISVEAMVGRIPVPSLT